MFNYNQMGAAAQARQSQMLKEAEQKRLANMAHSGQPRFRFLSWLLSNFRRQPVTTQSQTSSRREVKRKTASNPL